MSHRETPKMTHLKLAPGKLVIASHNAGKVREIRALLAPYGIEPVSADDLGLPEPEETGTTFRDNALLKAHASAAASGLPARSDARRVGKAGVRQCRSRWSPYH